MEAKELVIGDLVNITKGNLTGRIVDINSSRDFVGFYNIDAEERCLEAAYMKYVEPIPLTEEILKANADGGSCSFDEFRSLFHLKSNGYHREISISFDKTWYVPFVEITGMGRTTIKVNIQHVHELQHALRLCGLNDLADNFKIMTDEQQN